MNREDKLQLKKNIIKFIIGIILLSMSFFYVQKHPAEKVSIFSWFEVMFQKVQVVIQNIFWKQWDELSKKYKLIESYGELVNMAENNKCIEPDVVININQDYKNLKEEEVSTLAETLPRYITKWYEYKNILTKECNK